MLESLFFSPVWFVEFSPATVLKEAVANSLPGVDSLSGGGVFIRGWILINSNNIKARYVQLTDCSYVQLTNCSYVQLTDCSFVQLTDCSCVQLTDCSCVQLTACSYVLVADSSAVCKLPNCSKPRNINEMGKVHDYCSKSHAVIHAQGNCASFIAEGEYYKLYIVEHLLVCLIS